ncbi:MAG: hypothetical protein R3233_07395 [Xanthomonadales bacterium]|nr:hypothetical protein [Xanthomonadales bacterium]
MSSCLHQLFSDAPRCWSECLAAVSDGDQLLLLGRGALLLHSDDFLEAACGLAPGAGLVHAGSVVHGADEGTGAFDVTDDAGWVAAVKRHLHTLSWI